MLLPGNSTVNLSSRSGPLEVEWRNPDNGVKTAGGEASGGQQIFIPPFSDAVLYLRGRNDWVEAALVMLCKEPIELSQGSLRSVFRAVLEHFRTPWRMVGYNR
jgi:hypothetical protein